MVSSAKDTPHSSMHSASCSLTGIGCGTGYLNIWRGGWLEIGAEMAGRKDGTYIVTRYPE
jgi:hypothetical protein